ncbi:LexA family protein [Streptomyces justiciae]|uniref:LexA family protein n=1 Tax=Streptomyces justiciae TaxID=2780140 RepID=UPI002AD5789D|nr:hypothetical protein [Streptomyces justiciae]
MATTDVDVHRWCIPVEAALDQPIRLGWTRLDATLPLGLTPLSRRDLIPHPSQGEDEPRLQDLESGQVGRQVAHASSLRRKSNKVSTGVMGRHKVDYLTDTQERILRVIRETIADRGEAPTVQEIGAAVGLRSRASVHYQLVELEMKGAIVREVGRSRGIRLA